MASVIRLRPAGRADEHFLREMLYLAIYVPEGAPRPPRNIVDNPYLATYTCGWGREGDVGVIARLVPAGQDVGAAWLRLLTGNEKGYGYIDDHTPELSIAVVEGLRGRGIGTRLIEAVTAAAAPRYRAVTLSVSEGNPARRLYARAGFTVVRQAGDSLIMVKYLSPSEPPGDELA